MESKILLFAYVVKIDETGRIQSWNCSVRYETEFFSYYPLMVSWSLESLS